MKMILKLNFGAKFAKQVQRFDPVCDQGPLQSVIISHLFYEFRKFPPKPLWGGVGTASSNKYGSRGQSCAVVRGRSCVVGRSRAWSVIRGRAGSCRSARFAASIAVARTNE